MNALAKYLCKKLDPELAKHRVVVFYDPRREFAPFFERDLENAGGAGVGLLRVFVGERLTLIARYDGSFFGLRGAVEPVVAADQPDPLVVYVPGVERDAKQSVLMELEKAGKVYEPQLRRHARTLLSEFLTDGAIDDMLAPETLAYDDVVGYLEQAASGGQASILRSIFGAGPSEGILVRWLADESKDGIIVERGGVDELYRLIAARIGLELPSEATASETRGSTIRYVLVNEFRSDFDGDPPESLGMVPGPKTREQQDRTFEIARELRARHADSYASLADQVEADLNLRSANIDPECLGTTDTFRFEEESLLENAIDLTEQKRYEAALAIVGQRASSFWVDRDVARQAQWEACRRSAELGRLDAQIRAELDEGLRDAAALVDAYSREGGWFEADRMQRAVETWIGQMDDEPEVGRALEVVRQEHDELLGRMSSAFSTALVDSSWSIPGALHQTRIHSDVVEAAGGRVAYFLVDALRYEMGAELSRQLQNVEDLTIRPALAALPTVTPIGMAALLPGASASFSVVADRGKLAARIDGTVMPGLPARLKFLKTRVPDAVELTLGKVLQAQPKKLVSTIGQSSLVLVRSQEIDIGGESDSELLARHLMETTIANVARAIRKLAAAGVESFVVTADHGHQFSRRREDDMRTESPGGETIALHRRCWAGRGGANPPGTVRVSAQDLGYDTDLDFVFPTGLGVFKAGGGLTYHHGGISPQEMVTPVLSFRVRPAAPPAAARQEVQLADIPEKITNRTFGVRVALVGDLLTTEPISLRVVLLAGNQQVGQAGMAVGAELDDESAILTMSPGSEASVGVMLTVDDCEEVRLVVLDPATDAVLAQSGTIPVKLGI